MRTGSITHGRPSGRILLLTLASALLLAGAGSAASAQRGDERAFSDTETDVSGARFAGNDELSFDEAFARFDDATIPDIAPEAVDITEIEPSTETARALGTGVASFYGRRFHGRRTANGERFNMRALTAAHKTLPFGTRVRVTNLANGRDVVVRINDRGPFVRGRHIDLSRSAAEEIGMINTGHAQVEMEVLES